MSATIHLLHGGVTACLVNGPPSSWPDDHKWTDDWAYVTCKACLAGREIAITFTIGDAGKSIRCLRCEMTSHNLNDVEQHYCGYCHAHHDNIWPPARRAWVKNGLSVGELPHELVCLCAGFCVGLSTMDGRQFDDRDRLMLKRAGEYLIELGIWLHENKTKNKTHP